MRPAAGFYVVAALIHATPAYDSLASIELAQDLLHEGCLALEFG